MQRHKMDYFIKNSQLREDFKSAYPEGIYTLDLIRAGKRTATTRSHPLGEVGDRVILYNSVNPECEELIVEIDKVEHLSLETIEEFNEWSKKEGWSVVYLEENPDLKTKYQTTFHVVQNAANNMQSNPSETVLLADYKSCDNLVGRLDTLIWQMASIIFPISLAGLSYFALMTEHNREQFIVVTTVATGGIALLLTWYSLSRRWYEYQQLAFYRMREIEDQLGMWHYRYARFIRSTIKERMRYVEQIGSKNGDRFNSLASTFSKTPIFGLYRSMTLVTLIFISGWIAIIIREIILTF